MSRDGRVLRRGGLAGGVAGAAVALLLGVVGVVDGGAEGAVLLALLFGVAVGGLVASAWLLLAAGLDLLAGEAPGRRRLLVTGAVVAATALSQVLVAAALGGPAP